MQFSDAERDARSGEQWLSSVLHYVKFQAGSGWMKLHRAGQRFHPVRQHWISVFHTINDLIHHVQRDCECPYCQGAPFADQATPINYVPRKEPRAVHLPVQRLRAKKAVTA